MCFIYYIPLMYLNISYLEQQSIVNGIHGHLENALKNVEQVLKLIPEKNLLRKQTVEPAMDSRLRL